MTTFFLILISILPLALFILYLLYIDAFSLTKKTKLTYTVLWGVLSFFLSELLVKAFGLNEEGFGTLAYLSAIEEGLKGALIIWLINRKKIALVGDATIYGSAIGAGFGMVENIVFMLTSVDISFSEAVFKGFEAAVMHIGCTSTFAATAIMVKQGKYGTSQKAIRNGMIIACIVAVVIHYVHSLNDWKAFIHPIIMTILLVLYFFWSKHSLFKKNEQFIHDWIDNCINNDIALLAAIKQGKLSTTKAGEYMLTLKEHYRPEVFFDMCCYVSEYLELSIAAKSNLILKEAGLPIVKKDVNKSRMLEIKALQKQIGMTGVYSLSPIVKTDDIEKWVVDSLL